MAILSFVITRMWDGSEKSPECQGKNVHMTLKAETIDSAKGVRIDIVAPFYNDPAPSRLDGSANGSSGGAFFQLWDYEVVEAFFLAPPTKDSDDKEAYLELEFGPHSHHLGLLLHGRRNIIEKCLPIQYEAKIDTDKQTWHGSAWIPMEYFPPRLNKFNAYSIHGVGDDRKYEALFPVPGDVPDFHRLEHFQPIDFNRLRKDNEAAEFSDVWKSAMRKH